MQPSLSRNSDIRPISDLRNKFAEIADYVQSGNTVIFGSTPKLVESPLSGRMELMSAA